MKTMPVSWENDAEYARLKAFCARKQIGIERLHREAVRLVMKKPELLKIISEEAPAEKSSPE